MQVSGASTRYTESHIEATYNYQTTRVKQVDGKLTVSAEDIPLQFRTVRKPRQTGVMLVGWGGNNGTTVTAGIIANRDGISWRTKRGVQQPNYFGSITQASTLRLGLNENLEEVFFPLKDVVPMVNPNELAIGGWDCNNMNLGDAMQRAEVLDITLQEKLYPLMKGMVPLPAIFDLNFVAENQSERANNVIVGSKAEAVDKVRSDIRQFKEQNGLESVIVLWTANTERYSDITAGVHDTEENLLAALAAGHAEVAPSVCYAIAALLEGCAYINGAPQNTLIPAIIDMATRRGLFVGGDDFKSGQTKMKSAIVEFFVGAGIKPECIASYNHLGNNDGRNLASPKQFRSKEISKSNVVDDMVASNSILYPPGTSKPDHCIVIKYLPYVADSKRALDEYIFSIFMGGEQSIVMHNTCQDSLLAAPLIIDLIVLTELMQRIEVSEGGKPSSGMFSVLSILSYLLKAPMVPNGMPVINALSRQKQAVDNLLRALVGLPPDNNMLLECRFPNLQRRQ